MNEGFELSDVVQVPAGDYTTRERGIMASTGRKRPLPLSLMAADQHYYHGTIQTVETAINLAPSAHLALQTSYTNSRVRLPGGAFDSHVGSLRVVWAFSSRLSAQALIQYNSMDHRIIANARLHFIHHPGSDFFQVLNEERGSPASTWSFARRDAVMKLTYLFRL